jgi:hypothetical protein
MAPQESLTQCLQELATAPHPQSAESNQHRPPTRSTDTAKVQRMHIRISGTDYDWNETR